jgi:hypothetical protein
MSICSSKIFLGSLTLAERALRGGIGADPVEVHVGSGPSQEFGCGVLYGLDPTNISSFLYYTLGTILMSVVLLYFNVGTVFYIVLQMQKMQKLQA